MRAVANIFAGANGAGKTTLYFLKQEQGENLGYRVNVDEIAQSIGDVRDRRNQIRASKIAIKMRSMYLREKLSFNQETTLCGSAILRLFSKLRAQDFKVVLYFVGLDSAKTARERVKMRVQKGGHDIAPHLIEKRYCESMRNFARVAPLCDEIFIYDNTENYEIVAEMRRGAWNVRKNVMWLKALQL